MSEVDPELIAGFITGDPDVFNEKWGWAVRGEEPPEGPLRPKRKKREFDLDQERERERAMLFRSAQKRDVADELLRKQRRASAAKALRRRAERERAKSARSEVPTERLPGTSTERLPEVPTERLPGTSTERLPGGLDEVDYADGS